MIFRVLHFFGAMVKGFFISRIFFNKKGRELLEFYFAFSEYSFIVVHHFPQDIRFLLVSTEFNKNTRNDSNWVK